jgi:hypothetical protein
MNKCKRCGSYAINVRSHGRNDTESLDLCDVCFWRNRAEQHEALLEKIKMAFTKDKEV